MRLIHLPSSGVQRTGLAGCSRDLEQLPVFLHLHAGVTQQKHLVEATANKCTGALEC